MSRYIDYDAIDYRNDKMHDKSSDFIDGVIYMAQRIEEAPSIDIVRYKDCKWFDDSEHCPCDVETPTGRYITDLGNDGYCSHGERKTEPTISKMEQVDKDINVRSKERSNE